MLAGCESGLKCGYDGFCECVPFSKNPLCQCTGSFTDPMTGDVVNSCTLGKKGTCVSSRDATVACYSVVNPLAAPAPDLCEPGMTTNNLGQCVCEPLSSNVNCLPKPPPTTPNEGNVCAKFTGECKSQYNVNYAVYQGSKEITSGTSTV